MSILISDILTQEQTLADVEVSSKKKLLELLASLVAETLDSASSDDVFEKLLSRERMGSTGIGHGIAIPHCRLLTCNSALGFLLRLKEPIDYDAIDGRPVDLVFALVVPEESTDEHLQLLATLATNFSQSEFRDALRCAPDVSRLYNRAIADRDN